MTWVWASLIVIGVVMIAVAVWPSRRKGKAEPEDHHPEGVG
ncbi:hypothetical protein [Paractinoplanes rishiriensis]|nr:hypothetical protein [Actinoplanes rishiriensis]